MRGAIALAILLTSACTTTRAPSPSPTRIPTATPTVAATATATPTADCVGRLLASMTVAQRVGQLFLVGLANDQLGAAEIDAIRSRHLGSVWFVETSTAGVAGIRRVADAVQALADRSATAGVRFFVAANQEGGVIQALSGPGFSRIPSAVVQGTTDPAQLRRMSAQWAAELTSAGVNLNFAPVVDVVPPGTDVQNAPIGALGRAYGHDPATVSAHVLAFLSGMADAGVATTGKHFPGLGRVQGNTDFTASVVDDATTVNDPFLAPFQDASAGGVPFMMVALATYERIDRASLAVFSSAVMRDLLRTRLGFAGVVVSDDLGATVAVASIAPADRALRFITAGGDLIISKTVAPAIAMADALTAAAASDADMRARIDDAAMRVLREKARRGLVSC
jgi:beta-N-acetylhexosaminidase